MAPTTEIVLEHVLELYDWALKNNFEHYTCLLRKPSIL